MELVLGADGTLAAAQVRAAAGILSEMGAKVVFLEERAAAGPEPRRVTVPLAAVARDAGRARVRVLGGGGPWGGLTYPGDRPRLVALLDSLTARGEYPRDLWA